MIIIKIYAAIFVMDVVLIAIYIYTGRLRERREIRHMINDIFNQKQRTA